MSTFLLLNAAGTDTGEEVGAENTDGEHHKNEGDEELNERREHFAHLEGHTTNRDLELRDTLASSCRRGKERGHDAIRKGSEELGHHVAEVEASRQNDNILSIEHFICRSREKTDSFGALEEDVEEMDPQEQVMNAIRMYQTCPTDALATLQFYYSLRPTKEDSSGESFAEQTICEMLYNVDYLRDDEGEIMVEESIEYAKHELDDLFYYIHSSSFNRTMNRMKKLKEDLMAATWHPRRIERILELGGHEALDNFAGL
jgi:hypothetical protein